MVCGWMLAGSPCRCPWAARRRKVVAVVDMGDVDVVRAGAHGPTWGPDGPGLTPSRRRTRARRGTHAQGGWLMLTGLVGGARVVLDRGATPCTLGAAILLTGSAVRFTLPVSGRLSPSTATCAPIGPAPFGPASASLRIVRPGSSRWRQAG